MQRDPVDLPLFRWSPPPKVAVFPSAKRRPFVLKNAAHAAGMSPKGADNWIGHLVAKHRNRLARLGVDPVAAATDAAALETALRVELARILGRGAA